MKAFRCRIRLRQADRLFPRYAKFFPVIRLRKGNVFSRLRDRCCDKRRLICLRLLFQSYGCYSARGRLVRHRPHGSLIDFVKRAALRGGPLCYATRRSVGSLASSGTRAAASKRVQPPIFVARDFKRNKPAGSAFPYICSKSNSMRTRSKRPRFGELVIHAAMGGGLGIFLSLMLIINEDVFRAIINSSNPKTMILLFIGMFSSVLAVGSALTGLIFSAIEDSEAGP